MRNLAKTVFLIAIAACVLSCAGEGSLPLYYTQEMVTAAEGKLLSDEGLTYEVLNSGKAIGDGRWFAGCFVMGRKSDKVLEVKLNNLEQALSKSVPKLSGSSEEELGNDPINIENIWISGTYVNMRNGHNYDSGKTGTIHKVNLVFDDARSGTDTLFFSLRHNAAGEKGDTYISYYTSFPFNEYIPSGKTGCIVTIEWKWDKDYSISAPYRIRD